MSFQQYILLEFFREVQDAVRHIDHLEENVLTFGKDGVNKTLDYIENIIEYFIGSTKYKISSKMDGAPAIVAGKDPSGNFFVASKSAFAKSPKINYSLEDIDINHSESPGLAAKLKLAFQYLPELELQGIYQMDYMFDDELKQRYTPKTVDGAINRNAFISFQPNTIIYAVSPESPYGQKINKAKIGVAIHIEYQVVDGVLRIKKYTTNPEEFKSTPNVFVFNVLFDKPTNPETNITDVLMKEIDNRKKLINKLTSKINFAKLTPHAASMKTYMNKEVAQGEFLDNPAVSVERYISYVNNFWQKQINALKTEKGKLSKQQARDEILDDLNNAKKDLTNVFHVVKHVADIKNIFIKVFNEITKNSNLGQYFADEQGNWVSAAPEGYAVSRTDDRGPDITKLVSRKDFSHRNITAGKFSKKNVPQ